MAVKITKEQVLEKLKDVYDPEIPINIVDLGLIYGVEVNDDNQVNVQMTLTAPGCPMAQYIARQAEGAIAEMEGLEGVSVELTFDPPWTPERLTEDGKKLLGI